jgi:hypothetical protein
VRAVRVEQDDGARDRPDRAPRLADGRCHHFRRRERARERRRQRVQPLGALVAPPLPRIEPGVHQCGGGAPPELQRDRQVVGGVAAAAFGREERQDTQPLARRLERHGHARAHAERPPRGQVLVVVSVRREVLVPHVAEEQRLARREHGARGALPLKVGGPAAVERLSSSEQRRIVVRHGEPPELAVLVERVHHRAVGERREGGARDREGGLPQVE